MLSIPRTVAVLLSIALGVSAAYWGQPYIQGNDAAINTLVTVFSILAGFLVAIIAVVGEAAVLTPGSWRAAEMERESALRRLERHRVLFLLYIATLLLVFISAVIGTELPTTALWIERTFVFLATIAFFWSFWLPFALIRAQRERIDRYIEQRRAEAGLKP